MYKISVIIFICMCGVTFAQQLPAVDHGLMLSYINSNRLIPGQPAQAPINAATVDYTFHLNFKNHLSFKTGASVFITGHKFTYNSSPDRGYLNGATTSAKSVYAYVRIPALLSFNIKRFFIDMGAAPCFRVFNNSDTYYQRGNGIDKPGFMYTLESHVGYYIPVKQRRLFIEGAVFFSEIGHSIFLPGGNYKNNYSRNFQLGIGFMFNKYN